MIHISQDGSGDYSTITEALCSVPKQNHNEIIFYIHKGIYKERLTVNIPHITFIGEGRDSTVITYDLSAREILEDGMKRGTFRSYSCLIDTDHFKASHLTFENTAGPGPFAGQALAMYADGDHLIFEDCCFLGNQDTIFTGPLPPKEIEKNGFIGPKQYSPRINGKQYYKNCYFEGDIDFIFGSATAYFETCEFFSKNIQREINGYVTASSTPKGQKYGYVMDHCRFTGNCPSASVYLGRPWRNYAQVVLLHCEIGEHICPEGWHDWNKQDAHDTVFFAEYESSGNNLDMSKRPKWVKKLTEEEAKHYKKEYVLENF